MAHRTDLQSVLAGGWRFDQAVMACEGMTRLTLQGTRTTNYYEAHATEFFERTVSVDMAELRTTFTRLLPAGVSIVDVGCGSGRDSKAFVDAGFRVTAIDASLPMAQLARNYTGLEVSNIPFQDMVFKASVRRDLGVRIVAPHSYFAGIDCIR
jgi:SAM-dependent methyltransferase